MFICVGVTVCACVCASACVSVYADDRNDSYIFVSYGNCMRWPYAHNTPFILLFCTVEGTVV